MTSSNDGCLQLSSLAFIGCFIAGAYPLSIYLKEEANHVLPIVMSKGVLGVQMYELTVKKLTVETMQVRETIKLSGYRSVLANIVGLVNSSIADIFRTCHLVCKACFVSSIS